jgi:hypothetical protein
VPFQLLDCFIAIFGVLDLEGGTAALDNGCDFLQIIAPQDKWLVIL